MAREILVVPRAILFNEGSFHGFVPLEEEDFIPAILSNFEFRKRDDVEEDSSWQQPIPYVWIVNPREKKVFAYQRATDRNYSEKRLGGKWSCGVGGHIDKKSEEHSENPLLDAMMRELSEEVVMKNYPTPRVVGFINDDSNLVGQVHFGIVAVAETDGEVKKGDDEMAHGKFYSVDELDRIFSDSANDVESWTRLSWNFVREYLLKRDI